MIAEDFALYDALNCLALAVGEAESGRPPMAEAAWKAAVTASAGALPACSDGPAALRLLLGAASPARTGQPGRALLWNALNAASLAVLPAMTGNGPDTATALNDLDAAASMLAPPLRDAFTAVADAIGALAMTAVTA